MIRISRSKDLRLLASVIVIVMVVGLAMEVEARGRGGSGRGGGGFGGGARGGISRGGPARGGSIQNHRSGGGYRSYERGSGSYGSRDYSGMRTREGAGGSREGSFENRRGETIDYSGDVKRTDDGFERRGSWTSTSGASGGGSSSVTVGDGKVQSVDRSRHAESAGGETIDREVNSERHGDHVDREGKIQTSTGIDAESKGRIVKTDDGFIARGAVVGENGAAGGTVVRKGDQTYARGVASDGEHVTWGRAHCNGSHCYGGRVTADIDHYYRYPYYYYPYYYGWYSCPPGSLSTWYNRYGTPVYGCSNVVVIHTTISLGSSDGSDVSSTEGKGLAGSDSKQTWPNESQVSSWPVLMYELSDDVVCYATNHAPVDVDSSKHGDHYFWVPGPAEGSKEIDAWDSTAAKMDVPTANSTIITYTVGERTVYLTNERPIPGYFSAPADELFVWIPGVQDPSDEERALIDRVAAAHQAGGKDALDREVRKLQKGRDAPPEIARGKEE